MLRAAAPEHPSTLCRTNAMALPGAAEMMTVVGTPSLMAVGSTCTYSGDDGCGGGDDGSDGGGGNCGGGNGIGGDGGGGDGIGGDGGGGDGARCTISRTLSARAKCSSWDGLG